MSKFVCKKKGCHCAFDTESQAEDHYEKEHICFICQEDFTEKERKKLSCPNKECSHTFCKRCLKKNIMTDREDSDGSIRCLGCSQVLDIDYLCSCNFGSEFFNKIVFPKAMKNTLKEQEIQLQGTQKYAKWQNDTDHWRKVIRPEFMSEIKSLKAKIDTLQTELYSCMPIYDPRDEEKGFMFRCPSESCNGFVDNSGICGMCQKIYCTECREEKCESHVCKPEVLENLEFLKRQSKPCPHCGIFTMKSEGCSQMWCRNCHQFWDFLSGQIIEIYSRHQIHNPDFFAWERSRNVVIPRREERMSDQVPTSESQISLILKTNPVYFSNFNDVTYILRNISLVEWELRYLARNESHIYREIRSKYIRGLIDEKTFQKKIFTQKKKEIKNRRISAMYEEYNRQKKLIVRNILDLVEEYTQYRIKKVDLRTQPPSSSYVFCQPKLTEIFFTSIIDQVCNSDRLTRLYDDEIRKIMKETGYPTPRYHHHYLSSRGYSTSETYKRKKLPPIGLVLEAAPK